MARLSFGAVMLGLLACVGSPPPSAARSAAELAAAAAPSFAPHPEDMGQGCSPKGCLRAPPEAALVAQSAAPPAAPARVRARPPVVRHVVNGKSEMLKPGMTGYVKPPDTVRHKTGSAGAKAVVIWVPGDEAKKIVARWTQQH